MLVSVVIPAHNPHFGRLSRTLAGLKQQSLDVSQWELVIIDNASASPLSAGAFVDIAPPNLRIVRENQLGLTAARLRGFAETSGQIIILVDDDNVLASDYLEQALALAARYLKLGTWSGNVILEFEPDAIPPAAAWRPYLTERIVAADEQSSDPMHDASTPWGAGFCLRREVAVAYTTELHNNPLRRQLDLHGNTLLFGGDTDIAYVACEHGFTKGVFSCLKLIHLIPASRCHPSYLLRSIEGHAYSTVLHGYILTGQIKPWFTDRVWLARLFLKRLFLPKLARQEATAKARGISRAVKNIRDLSRNKTSPTQ